MRLNQFSFLAEKFIAEVRDAADQEYVLARAATSSGAPRLRRENLESVRWCSSCAGAAAAEMWFPTVAASAAVDVIASSFV